VRHVARSLRRSGLVVRVPSVLAARYGVVESRVEKSAVGASSQVALNPKPYTLHPTPYTLNPKT
jgi:hypothetical protein